MRTEHRVVSGDARSMDELPDESVDLLVTSPPYPMIEMWDETFAALDPDVESALAEGEGRAAFEMMHAVLDDVWTEADRVLSDGAIACVNVGDATRSLDGRFRCYPNHARVVDAFDRLGFDVLPDILWRKPTNRTTKFLGSGMLPSNAYVSLEHEYVLVFRKGGPRRFEPGDERRYESAYFWEERNVWFSDVWTDVTGTSQPLSDDELRERSAAYPFEIPYRLINMYSIYGDTVLDPFWGTGTTSLAAMASARNSVGFELEPAFVTAFDAQLSTIRELARARIDERLTRHEEFVEERERQGTAFDYRATNYDVPVTTKQERDVQFYGIDRIEREDDRYVLQHDPYRR